MKQPDGRKKRKQPDIPDDPMASYTPEQRRLIRNGLGIWARVAIRSYLRKHGTECRSDTDMKEEGVDGSPSDPDPQV